MFYKILQKFLWYLQDFSKNYYILVVNISVKKSNCLIIFNIVITITNEILI